MPDSSGDKTPDWDNWKQEAVENGEGPPAVIHLIAMAGKGECSWHEAIMGGLAVVQAHRNVQDTQSQGETKDG